MNMKYFNYITILLAILMTACNTDDTIINVHGNNATNQLQIVGRNIPFTDYDVASRTADNDITMVDFVIFYATTDQEGNSVSECVYYAHSENTIFALDRASLVEKIGQDKAENCYMFMVANYPEIYAKICEDAQSTDQNVLQNFVQGKTFDYFLGITSEVTPISGVPEGGLPRFGIYGKTPETPQGTSIDFTQEIPGGTTYEIPMECLFAKMVFNISVDPDQTATDISTEIIPNSFKLTGYTIHNLATSIDMNQGTENSMHDNVGVYTDPIVGNMDGVNTNDVHNVSFTFYLPERFFKPVKSATEFVYPFGSGEVKTKDNPTGTIREEDAELRQRYKPLLAKGHTGYNTDYNEASDEKATYVTFTGEFINHQGHSYDVSYDIYVGGDNFGNFDVVRNRQYNNNITIKGIQNAQDQSSNKGAISIDHRVNITRTKPIITNMRWETILDAHFEVRPLRIRQNVGHTYAEGVTPPTTVKVEVLNADGTNTNIPIWIRLERSYGTDNITTIDPNNYCTQGSAAGKRKYFTYGLVSGKQLDNTVEPYNISANTSVTVPISKDGECVWIYVDECTEASYDINAVRSAMIRVTCGDEPPTDYIVNQHKLFAVDTQRKELNDGKTYTYFIEHEEEYLHNFDSDDTFTGNQTQYEGMPWGLNGIQLSNQHDAVHITAEPSGIIASILQFFGFTNTEELANQKLKENGWNPKYDFYLSRDNVPEELTIRDFSGYDFNTEIAKYLIGNYANNTDAKINITLDETPKSAFAYCYNRNKRNYEGNVVSQDWYLPAIDEIEDIMESAHEYFDDFHGKLYWSCQPAYIKNSVVIEYWKNNLFGGSTQESDIEGDFYLDDTSRARATNAVYENGTFNTVMSSGAAYSGVQNGKLTVNWSGTNATYTHGEYKDNDGNGYDGHPGNKSRTDRARVRAIRKTATLETTGN